MTDVHFANFLLCYPGSRAGAVIAACWATMMLIGRDGYVDATRRIIETTRHIEAKSVFSLLPSVFELLMAVSCQHCCDVMV